MNNYIKALCKNGEAGFMFYKMKFPKLSGAKIREGVFDEPQIRQLMLHCDFEKSLTGLEKGTCISVKAVIKKFLGNTKFRN